MSPLYVTFAQMTSASACPVKLETVLQVPDILWNFNPNAAIKIHI